MNQISTTIDQFIVAPGLLCNIPNSKWWTASPLIDQISDGIITTDLDFNIKGWNRATERYLGFRYEEVFNHFYREIFQFEAKGFTLEQIRAEIITARTWSGELCITRNNQAPVYVQATINAIRDANGEHIGYIGVGHNITNEKKVLEESLFKQQRFISFMENTSSLAWINDENGVLVYMNSLFRDSFGLPADAVGKNVYAYYPDDMRKTCMESDARVLDGNSRITVQEEGKDSAGNPVYYQVFKFPVESRDSERLIGGMAIDITAHMTTSNALLKNNQLYENAGQATRDVIWDWDLKENTIRRIGGFKTLFGHELDEDLIEFNSVNIHPDDAMAATKSWQEALSNGSTRWQHEFRYRCADGSYKPVIDQACIIRDEQGNAIRMIGSMQDISEERKLQQQILETEQKKKQEVVAAVIDAQEKERREISNELHDNVNQLLAATILFLKTAQKQPQAPAQLIGQGLDYLQKAIDEIRNISHNLNPGSLSVNGFAAALKDLADRLSIPGSLAMEVKIGEAFDENLLSDHTRLTLFRMVQEEVNNILKHAGADKVTIGLTIEAGILLLTVKDNGKGFDLARVRKGLGLANIFTRAETIGGKADISSSPGNGCVLSIRVPLHPPNGVE